MSPAAANRARTATVVVVGPAERLTEAVAVLGRDAGALRIVPISTESEVAPAIETTPDVVALGGLRPEYVNNAIAGVRFSSLPTVVWWRGGLPEGLDGVASLADRVIIDALDPWPLWTRTPALYEETAFTDLRWTRLTRWRSAMAHFFDLPQVQALSPTLRRLTICGSDRAQGALFAGWLDASLAWNGRVAIEFGDGRAPMESVTLAADEGALSLALLPNQTCLETEARRAKEVLASRVVSLGDQHLHTLVAEELRVRSRDLAFERALERAIALPR